MVSSPTRSACSRTRTMPSRPDGSVRLEAGDAAIDVDLSAGARATRWQVGEHQLLAAYGPGAVHHGMYPMAPWAGRLRGNSVTWDGRTFDLPVTQDVWALHGTALASPATIVDLIRESDHARLVGHITEHPGWPWPVAVDITWDLRPDTLTTTIEVQALADAFPVVSGWHPWFRRRLDVGQDAQWSLAATGRLERGADHLPTGEVVPFDAGAGPFDDAFVVPSGRASITWPGALALEIASDGGWYVVFDELPGCVCVEPQSGPPDGLRQAHGHTVEVAEPGRPHRLTTTWTWRPLR
jgi:aldose 1-epimerase